MRFAFTEEQDMLRDMVRSALESEASLPKVRRWAEAQDSAEFDRFVASQGWAGLGWPEALGGQGGGLLEQAVLFEELGRSAAPSGVLLAANAMALSLLLPLASSPDARPGVAALGAGSETAAVLAPAGQALDHRAMSAGVRCVDGLLSGQVPWVLAAAQVAHWLVPVREGDGVSLWRLPRDAAGVQLQPRSLIDRTRALADVQLSQVRGQCLGRLDAAQLEHAQARVAVLLAAESLGLARRMLAMTVEYVGQRVQFGVPVGSFQAVKHCAADMLVDTEAVHSGVYFAAWALQEGEADGLMHAWIAKATATEAAVRCADRALQLHGAIGYTWEHDLQLFYKRAKLNLELGGPPRHYRERIAAALALA